MALSSKPGLHSQTPVSRHLPQSAETLGSELQVWSWPRTQGARFAPGCGAASGASAGGAPSEGSGSALGGSGSACGWFAQAKAVAPSRSEVTTRAMARTRFIHGEYHAPGIEARKRAVGLGCGVYARSSVMGPPR